ncbi:Alcohol dehydrogenase 1-like protein [Drosera capensis]
MTLDTLDGKIVDSVGEGVTELVPGDYVLPIFTGECKQCHKKFGVTDFINPKDNDKPVQQPTVILSKVIIEATDGGVDRSVQCTGSNSAMIFAFECDNDGWAVCVLVGVPNKDDAFKTHPINFLNERTLKGTFYGNFKPR